MSLMRKHCGAFLIVVLTLSGFTTSASAQEAPQDVYRAPEVWLCKPGRQDLCAGDLGSTAIAPDGSSSRETWKPDPAAPIDCFYVYPTISDDPAGNSGWVPGPGEIRAVQQQFARFAAVCRPYAPMYRQVTLAGLRSLMAGKPIAIDSELGYQDVLAAWKHYLKYDNQGRGVVLIGHSQGSRMLSQLIQREIEGTPVQSRLISALLPGFNVEIPAGNDRGGTFKHIPFCKSATQIGCVITYVSFRSSSPPPSNTRFGRTKTPGMATACVNPAELSGAELRSYLPVQSNLLGQPANQADWVRFVSRLGTPFVSLPGLLDARCVSEGGASYLAISMHANPQDRRPADIPGDIVSNGRILDDWGLHLVDVNLAAGNLIDIVRQESAAYVAGVRTVSEVE